MNIRDGLLKVGRNVTSGSITLLFFLALACHLMDAFYLKFGQPMLSGRVVIWFFVMIIGYITLKSRDYGFDPYALFHCALLSAFSVMVPYLKGWLDLALPSSFGNFMVIFAPVWLIYILYFLPDAPSWIRGMGTTYLIFWMTIAILYGFRIGAFAKIEDLRAGYIDVWQPLSIVKDMIVQGLKDSVQWLSTFGKRLDETQNKYVQGAVGTDLYAGKVDQNAQEKLGVYLQEIKPSQPEFFTEDPVAVWATIVARTLDRPMLVRVNCIADKGTTQQRKADKVIPSYPYEVYTTDEADLDCSFEPRALAKGTHKISIIANFTFSTLAYQKVYFIDKSRALAMAREDTDILEYYGIKDKKPVTIYTNGPVMIGMDVRNMPVKLDRKTPNQQLMLGISIKNQWQGRVLNVTGLKLIFPSFARLDGYKCGSYEFEEQEQGAYKLKRTLSEIKDYKTLRCPVVISNVEQALGQTPISIQYFKVTTNYTYELEKSISITIKESNDELNLLAETKKTAPKFDTIADITLKNGETWQEYLLKYASDQETQKEGLVFSIVSQSRLDVAECAIQQGTYIVCTGLKDGVSEIAVQVSDKALINKTKFKVTVGQPTTQQSSTTTPSATSTTSPSATSSTPAQKSCADLVNTVVYCEADTSGFTKARNEKGCVSLCEYYAGCFGIGTGWTCGCTKTDCDVVGEGACAQKCPGNHNCCQDLYCCDRAAVPPNI